MTAKIDEPDASRLPSSMSKHWCACFVFLFTILLYSGSLFGGFVLLDDPQYVINNRMVRSGLSMKGIFQAWTTFECSNWHPITWLSLMLDYQLYGLKPWGFHLTNILFHALNSSLLFLWLAALFQKSNQYSRGVLLFITLVFASHPVHVESVSWIAERKDVLATFFGLISLLAHQRWIERGETRSKLVCLISFIASLCAKPLFVTLPCVLILIEAWPMLRWNTSPHVRSTNDSGARLGGNLRFLLWSAVDKWPFFIATCASCLLTYCAQGSGGAVSSLIQVPLRQRLLNAVVNYLSYLEKLFWPTRLCAFYPLERHSLFDSRLLIATVLVISLSLTAIRFRKQCPGLLMGWLWFLGTLVPMIGIVQVGSQAIADRYLYVPLIGATIATVVAMTGLLDYFRIPSSFRTVSCTCLIFCFSWLTWNQVKTWSDTEALARQCLNVVRDNWNGHLLLGCAFSEQGRDHEAIAEYQVALKTVPDLWNGHLQLANSYLKTGQQTAAVDEYKTVIRLRPSSTAVRVKLIGLFLDIGRLENALEEIQTAEEFEPENGLLRMRFANMLAEAGHVQRALEHYEQATDLLKDHFDLYLNYGTAWLLNGHPEKALALLKRSVELSPDDPIAKLRYSHAVLTAESSSQEQIHSALHTCQEILDRMSSPEAFIILAEASQRHSSASVDMQRYRGLMDRASKEGRQDLVRRGHAFVDQSGNEPQVSKLDRETR